MKNHWKSLVIFGAVALAAAPCLAQGRGGGGGHGGGGGIGMGAGGGFGGPMGPGPMGIGGQSGLNGNFGGRSDSHIGAQGRFNSNGPNAATREFGTDRATARRGADVDADAQGRAANELGSLNAAHASATARAHAAGGSMVGSIGTYESQMRAALSLSDQTERNAAITQARQELALSSNKTLTAGAVTRLDSTLNIQGASPQLGTSP